MKLDIELDKKALSALVERYIENRFRNEARYMTQFVIEDMIKKKFSTKEINNIIKDGVVAYLEKYNIKDIIHQMVREVAKK